jgi:twitching motility two-component system response regulator PilH
MAYALVVDDNRQMADALVQMLGVLGLKAKAAYGSGPGMVVLGVETPDIVFLDINMPGVTGHEVLMFLRREPRLLHTPVIIVTSDDQPETKEKALKQGASAVLYKPAEFDDVEQTLSEFGLI